MSIAAKSSYAVKRTLDENAAIPAALPNAENRLGQRRVTFRIEV